MCSSVWSQADSHRALLHPICPMWFTMNSCSFFIFSPNIFFPFFDIFHSTLNNNLVIYLYNSICCSLLPEPFQHDVIFVPMTVSSLDCKHLEGKDNMIFPHLLLHLLLQYWTQNKFSINTE